MDRQELLALFDKEQRIEIEIPGVEKHTLPHVVRFVSPAREKSFILYSNLAGVDPDAVIQEQIAFFEKRRQPFEWKVYDHDQPPDLCDLLSDARFEVEEAEAVMILDLETAPASLFAPSPSDEHPFTIHSITTPEGLADVILVEEQVWGNEFDWIVDRLGAHLEMPGYLNVYVAYVDDEPAAAGWIYFPSGNNLFADIWGGSTIKKFRRRGIYTALLACRAQEARRRGYRFLTIDASPMSRPIVAHHGFQLLTYAHACNWPPTD